jgi:phosphocarrier protein FPr/phosphocarrier protein
VSEDARETIQVVAPLGGWCATLDDSPDPVFSGRVLGDGVSIDPTDNVVRAPFDAEVITVPETRHAVNLRADNGAECLIHVGIDTVGLGGEGFAAHVEAGQRVVAGQELLTFDMDLLLERAASLRTPVLLLQSDAYTVSAPRQVGPVAAGDPIFTIRAGAPDRARESVPAGGPVTSRSVTVGLVHGIHARPAALLTESLRPFAARIECQVGNKSANARSAVELMALGVGHGAAVTVVATGEDGEAAIDALVPVLEPLDRAPEPGPAVTPESVPPPAPGAVLRGQVASTGLAIGKAVQVRPWSAADDASSGTPDEEQQRLDEARAVVHSFLTELAGSRTGASREIAEAHLALLEDPTIAEDAASRIRDGAPASVAWNEAISRLSDALGQLDDKRLRERVDDLADMNQRVQRALAGESPGDAIALPDEAIVIAHTLLPSQLLEMDRDRLAGICTAAGGTTSHVAILAASMDIPMLVAAGEAVLALEDDAELVVDADYGELHVQVGADRIAAFRQRQRYDAEQRHREQAAALDECVTNDGVHIHICANIASAADAEVAVERGADGSGLLRTEFLFMDRDTPPTREEQVAVYQQVSDALGDRLLVVRTLDAGGDKPIAYVDQAFEENPALGVRGVRLSLRDRAMFEIQLEALLQVHRSDPLRIMVPMVSCVDEVEDVRHMLADIRARRPESRNVQLGIMIETPAAALIADRLAEVVDFFSIGTNDLTQYTLAMDRGEPLLADRLDALHPAVLALIARTAKAGNYAGKPVGVCGGAAGDILAAPILVGLGIRELSMVTSMVARQKARLRGLSTSDCAELASRALAMTSAGEVRAMMREFTETGSTK